MVKIRLSSRDIWICKKSNIFLIHLRNNFLASKAQKTECIFLPLIAHIVRAPFKSVDAKGKLKDELIKLLSSQIIHVAK